ncbi:Aspartate--tRNA ligase [Geobacillus sp. BCO2]|nr:Aspartate--tRNA ligase [Geobacillus sp. BCO2]
MERTYYCGEVPETAVGERVVLKGWVQKRRDLGGLIFIDLRDRTGIVQVVASPDVSVEALAAAERVRSEYVLSVEGTVVARAPETVNPNIATGRIEIQAERIEIINEAKTPPFSISDDTDAAEDVRLKYRYLDLRRPVMFQTLALRHKITKTVRDFLDSERFLEIETPMLTKSTPEGARDYLVPSRVHPGEFYALPQSPQIFKQLLMVGGFERYYQIARCFRDEDLRADRQPEFTQIDIEMSFISQEDIIDLTERMMAAVVKAAKGIDIPRPFPRMTYAEAMNRYGSDKPDVRFGLELVDVSEAVRDSAFQVFARTVKEGGQVKAINVKGAASRYSRKDIDALGEFAARYGAKGSPG